MRVEGQATASPATADLFQQEMVRASHGLVSEYLISGTWNHEMSHFNSDRERNGLFGYDMKIEVSNGILVASWVCYYIPLGERTPEELMDIAQAPGFGKMSEQDKSVYEAAFQNWLLKMEEEKKKEAEARAEEQLAEEEPLPVLPALEAIPKKETEDENGYLKKVRLVQIFAEKIEELSKKGKLPSFDEIFSGRITDFWDTNYGELINAYSEARKEAEKDFRSKNSPDVVSSEQIDGEDVTERTWGNIYVSVSTGY